MTFEDIGHVEDTFHTTLWWCAKVAFILSPFWHAWVYTMGWWVGASWV